MNSINRKLFWALDLSLLLLAFVASSRVAPYFQAQLSAGGLFYGNWVKWLSPTDSSPFPPLSEYVWVFLLIAPATTTFIEILGGHAPIRNQKIYKTFIYGILAPLTGVGLLSTMFFILRTPGYSRLFVFSFAGSSCAIIVASRLVGHCWYRFMLNQGMYAEEVAIVGTPASVETIVRQFQKTAPPLEYRLVGHFSILDGQATSAIGDRSILGLPHLGAVEDVETVLVHQAIQRLVIALPSRSSEWLDQVVKTSDYFRVTTHIIPEVILTAGLKDLVPVLDPSPGRLPALTLAPHEFQSDWLAIKRLVDVFISGTLLLLLAPIFLVIAISIKVTTPHLTVFYPWQVVGYRGRRFKGYKFTTMVADADAQKDRLAELNEMSGPVFKIAKDPRITPLGRFLRKYSLNELPQLWSVLKGDMSLVGPRPAGPHELVRYELWHKRKLSAQPGITCLWQVSGRNKISSFDDWVRLDLEYIRTRSIWVDCKILARTVWVVARGTGS
jgi:exopolysaccharide biosynthesis polyprenyl glycosylphosphotransferase